MGRAGRSRRCARLCWRLHCETARTPAQAPSRVPRAGSRDALYGESARGRGFLQARGPCGRPRGPREGVGNRRETGGMKHRSQVSDSEGASLCLPERASGWRMRSRLKNPRCAVAHTSRSGPGPPPGPPPGPGAGLRPGCVSCPQTRRTGPGGGGGPTRRQSSRRQESLLTACPLKCSWRQKSV